MEKNRIIGIAALCILVLAASYFFITGIAGLPLSERQEIEKIESKLPTSKIVNLAGFNPVYQDIEVDYYYNYDYCSKILESVLKQFDGLVRIASSEKTKDYGEIYPLIKVNNLQLPVLMAKGPASLYDYSNNFIRNEQAYSILSGPEACSEKAIIAHLCSLISSKPSLCAKSNLARVNLDTEQISNENQECFESCSLRYLFGDRIVNKFWQGYPCEKISGYVEGKSGVKTKECDSNGCKNDPLDKGCCKPDECVSVGKCYPVNYFEDVDSDGSLETCAIIGAEAKWSNPDSRPSSCQGSKLRWLNCNNEECRYGIDDYDKEKLNGLCCGDENGENSLECKGSICSQSLDAACCKSGSCVYGGKCYSSGCNEIKIKLEEFDGSIYAFCDGESGKWNDLDKENCQECLGKDAWTELACCGDDPNEGTHVTPFIAVNQNGTTRFPYKGCAKTKSQCVHSGIDKPFEEGIYVFSNSFYLNGSYYCDGSVWYGIFDSKKYCKKSGFEWDKLTKTCCGDAENENYVKGADNTYACCPSQDYTSENGKCTALRQCGNEVLDYGEQCESPESDNNNYCIQSQESCDGQKFGTRSDKGYCNSKCRCEKTELEYSCVKGKCGSGCSNDLDCKGGTRCDPQSCSCTSKKFCGDGILQQKNDFGQKEECEPSGSPENRYCKVEECKGKKSIKQSIGINTLDYSYAPCKSDCTCDYSVEYKCQKDVCKSECNDDGSGCENGLSCDINSCLCKETDICGNGICEEGEEKSCPEDCHKYECPYRITLVFDKNSYVLNDSEKINVRAFDINNKPMKDVKFDLDILVNNVFIGSSSYSTMDGEFAIERKITNSAPSGSHTYIAKTRVPSCNVVVDNKIINVYVENPYTIPPGQFNLSRFEFLTPNFNVTYEKAQGAKCGDNSVTYGEACEGYGVCRASYGCDYENHAFDTPELCNGCSCPQDTKSEKNSFSYCQSCKTCGDGELNCNEECENGTKSFGHVCRFGRVYERVDICSGCLWEDDGPFSDDIVDDCKCECNSGQSGSCVGGNYLEFNSDYYSGCADGKCNECSCADAYTKDTDNDMIEDKCEEELCANGIDDNDNGFVDEGKCQWYSCYQCGYGLLNFCTRTECAKFTQGCFFSEYSAKIFSKPGYETGSCNTCSGVGFCSEYGKDGATCVSDPCELGKCTYNGTSCCTDSDADKACDLSDNCPDVYNDLQEDDDKDGYGNTCDACPNEPALLTPQNFTESNCSDGIDNDCDGLNDCADLDCKGILDCCQSSKDCRQDSCTLETCINNKCDYLERNLCDSSECKKGQYCDLSGKCTKKDESAEICMFCTNDNLPSGYSKTVSFGTFFRENSKLKETFCCGDEDSEYYISNSKFGKSGCCQHKTDCVNEKGTCINSGESAINQSIICIGGSLIDCTMNQAECKIHNQALQSIK